MKPNTWWKAGCLVVLCSTAAQAADIRLGLSGIVNFLPQIATDTPLTAPSLGVFISRTHQQAERRDFRSKLGIESLGGPVVRVDATWLSRSDLYFGGGVGTGMVFGMGEGTLFSPLGLSNLHAVVDKNFGPFQVEGQARLAFFPSVGVNISSLLR